jgi:PI-3-kinase-related kinase SMG-1
MPLPLEEADSQAPKKSATNSQVTDLDAKASLEGSSSRGSTQTASVARPSEDRSRNKGSSETLSLKLQIENGVAGDSQGPPTLEPAGKFEKSRRAGGLRPRLETHNDEKEATRRAFAESALRRFKVKLEGLSEQGAKTPAEGRRVVTLSVEEQVEKLLQQASSVDSLAQMYEGWTPWI